MTATLPRMDEIDIAAMTKPRRTGIYAAVYERLLDCQTRGKGPFVGFPSASASNVAISKMNAWANEDGFYVIYGKWLEKGRNVCLQTLEQEQA